MCCSSLSSSCLKYCSLSSYNSFLIILLLKFFRLCGIFSWYCVSYSNSNNQRFNVIFDILSKAVFFCFHTHPHFINPHRPSILYTYNLLKSLLGCSSLFIVIFFLVFPSLSHQVCFCPFHNSCTISHQRNSPCIYYYHFIPTIESTFHD